MRFGLIERFYAKRKTEEEKQKDNKRLEKEFKAFKRKIMSGKHSHWFECLNQDKRFQVFIQSKRKKFKQHNEGKSFSLNKFLFDIRKKKQFFVPKYILREKALNKILN